MTGTRIREKSHKPKIIKKNIALTMNVILRDLTQLVVQNALVF